MKTKTKLPSLFIYLFIYLLSFNLKAQFYGQMHYLHSKIFLSSACRTFNNPGYLMAGYSPTSSAGMPHFVIDKVDANGAFGSATEFSNEYSFVDTTDASCMSNAYHLKNFFGITVIETNNLGQGEAYAIAGAHLTGVFFATLDQSGNVIQTYRWDLPFQNTGNLSKRPGLQESPSNPGHYYICGYNDKTAYVMKVDATLGGIYSNPDWAFQYSNNNWMEAHALIESPYNPSDLIVVGRTDRNTAPLRAADAFFLKLDAGNGSVKTYTTINGSYDGDDWFECIEPASSTYGGSDGYIIGGRSDHLYRSPISGTVTGSTKTHTPWMTKVDRDGKIIWTSLINQNSTYYGMTVNGSITGVLERYNVNTNPASYEYYGVANSNALPSSVGVMHPNLVVFKLDDTGKDLTFSQDEFHYTDGQAWEGVWNWATSAGKLSQINTGGSDDGVQAFGTNTVSGGFYFSKAYFNGESGCYQELTDIDSIAPGPDSLNTEQIDVIPINASCQYIFQLSVTALSTTPSTLCFSNSGLSGGSNVRLVNGISETKTKSIEISVYPNPFNTKIKVTTAGIPPGTYELEILNTIGQKLYSDRIKIEDSINKVELDVSTLKIDNGIYYFSIKGKKFQHKEKIIKQSAE